MELIYYEAINKVCAYSIVGSEVKLYNPQKANKVVGVVDITELEMFETVETFSDGEMLMTDGDVLYTVREQSPEDEVVNVCYAVDLHNDILTIYEIDADEQINYDIYMDNVRHNHYDIVYRNNVNHINSIDNVLFMLEERDRKSLGNPNENRISMWGFNIWEARYD